MSVVIDVVSERRWTFANVAQIAEVASPTGEEAAKFGLGLGQGPFTRAQMEGVRDLITAMLQDVPATYILAPQRKTSIVVPKLLAVE